jgi:hypothetical protein
MAGGSELLGPQYGHHEIDEEGEGEEADKEDFHGREGEDAGQRAFSQKTA